MRPWPSDVPAPWRPFDDEARRLAGALRMQRLVVLVGAAGSGKTTFLGAGVLPLLPQAWFVGDWHDPALVATLLPPADAAARRFHVFDHFEQALDEAPASADLAAFRGAWQRALESSAPDLHFLVAIDEAAWPALQALLEDTAPFAASAWRLVPHDGRQTLVPIAATDDEAAGDDFDSSLGAILSKVSSAARPAPAAAVAAAAPAPEQAPSPPAAARPVPPAPPPMAAPPPEPVAPALRKARPLLLGGLALAAVVLITFVWLARPLPSAALAEAPLPAAPAAPTPVAAEPASAAAVTPPEPAASAQVAVVAVAAAPAASAEPAASAVAPLVAEAEAPAAPSPEPAPPLRRWELLVAGGAGSPQAETLAKALAAPGIAIDTVALPPAGNMAPSLQAPGRLASVQADALRTLPPRGARLLWPVAREQIVFLARRDGRLRWVHDLAGKRVDLGAAGSADARTAEDVYRRFFRAAPRRPSMLGGHDALAELVAFRSIDAMALVRADAAAWLAALEPSTAADLRVLQLDPRHAADRRALQAYERGMLESGPGLRAGERRPVLAVTTWLVASAGNDDAALADLARAWCNSGADAPLAAEAPRGWTVPAAVREALAACSAPGATARR